MLPDPEILKKSVTRDDYTDDAGRKRGGVLTFLGNGLGTPLMNSLPTQPPIWWTFQRDAVLRQTVLHESMWASAIYIACSKIASLTWQVRGPVPLQARRAYDLLRGTNWVPFVHRHLRDFLLTDNGAFIEIVRAGSGMGARVVGIIPLDSLRCQRTGDPEIPVIYRDRQNRLHEMKSHQIISFSDMPDAAETYFGVGLCAASRAYPAIYKLMALETYVTEKISGRRPLAIHFVNNVSPTMIKDALASADAIANQQGLQQYMGAVVVANIDPTASSNVATIDLAGLPDRFVPKEERLQAYLAYANAIGLDPQEISPELLASKAIGSGAQAKVIDDKASGKGLSAWKPQFESAINDWVISEKVNFFFRERDHRDLLQQAELESLRTTTAQARISAGILDAEQAKQMLVDDGDIPIEYLQVDLTNMTTLSSEEKPDAQGEPNPEGYLELERLQQEAQLRQLKGEQELYKKAGMVPGPDGSMMPKEQAAQLEAQAQAQAQAQSPQQMENTKAPTGKGKNVGTPATNTGHIRGLQGIRGESDAPNKKKPKK